MGLSDLVSNVISKYSADVSDHVRALEKLKGAERERAQSTIDAHKKVEESLQRHVDGLGKVKSALAGFGEAARVAYGLVTDYAERSRLESAAGGVQLEKLRLASRGLKSDATLLAEAAKLQSGAFKLTTEQMALAEAAMLAFTRKGADANEATAAVTQAIKELNVEGLEKLGVRVDNTGLSMDSAADRSEIFRRVMVGLGAASTDTAVQIELAGDKAAAMAIKAQNAIDRLKHTLGGIVAGAPGWIEEQTRAGARRIVASSPVLQYLGFNPIDEDEYQRRNGAPQGLTGGQFIGDVAGRSQIALNAAYAGRSGFVGQALAGNVPSDATGLDLLGGVFRGLGEQRYKPTGIADNSWGTSGVAKAGVGGRVSDEVLLELARARARQLVAVQLGGGNESTGRALTGDLGSMADVSPRDEFGRAMGFDLGAIYAGQEGVRRAEEGARLTDKWNKELAGNRSRESKLAQMFGPLEELNAYKIGFDALAGGVSAAMTAWIDGSKSAAAAFKDFIANALKGLAVQLAVEALKESAYGFASLAWPGGQGKAAIHFKSAALFAAGAAAAGIGAKALHGGGAPSTGAGAAAPVGNGGGGPQYQGRREVIVIGDSWGDNTPRQRALNTRRRVEEAYGASGVLNE